MDLNYELNPPKITNIKTLDLEHTCRICLEFESDDEDELYLIFDEKYAVNGIHLSRMIQECTSCDVIRYDKYPHQICKKCLYNVRVAYNFRKQCQNSHVLVRQFLGNVNTKTDMDNYEQKIFENEMLLAVEKSTQTESNLSYPCEKCDERFWTYDALSDHHFYKHRGTPNVCKICKQVFKRPGYLRDHLSLKHPETGVRSRNQCKICFKKFSQAGHLQRHLVSIHKCDDPQNYMENKVESNDSNNEPIECKKCSKYFSENEFNHHNCNNCQETESLIIPITNENKPGLSSDGLDEPEMKPDLSVDNEDCNGSNEHMSTDDEDSFPLAKFKMIKLKQSFINKDDSEIVSVFNDKSIFKENSIVSPNDKIENISDKTEDNRNNKKTRVGRKTYPRLKCDQCDKSFPNSGHLKRHQSTHLLLKIHCSICSKQFASEEYLKLHMNKVHSEERLYECKKCTKKFPKEWHLRLHNKKCINVKNKFSCSFEGCSEIFNTIRHLNTHIKKVHPTEETIWVCRYCQQQFHSRADIQKHSKLHDAEKPHLCNECGKKFSEVNHLNLHIMRHRGEKRLKCKYCEKRFIRTSDLQVHEMYHTGEKPHRCETCGKGFIRACTLRIHIRTHTGEKPYKCSYCDRSFAQKQDMTAHVRRLHTGERYNCPVCPEGYVHLYQLTQHKKSAHGIDEPSHIQRLAKINPETEKK